MDALTTPELDTASFIDIMSLRADSPTLVQVSSPKTSSRPQSANRLPQQRHTRNFSRKLYSQESSSTSSSRCPSGEIVSLKSGLSFISFSSPQPVDLDSKIEIEGPFSRTNSPSLKAALGAFAPAGTVTSRPTTPTKQSSVPSTPIASKPIRPNFGRSISMLDSRCAPNATVTSKAPSLPDTQMDQHRRPAFTRSPTSIGRPHAHRNSTNTFTNTVGEKLGWLRSRAFSNVSSTSTATLAPPSPAAVQQAQEDSDLSAADPLINLDISAALFPTGIVDFTDSSSFNGLLANATALIETLQTAYKQRTLEVNKLRSQQASQAEDLDEAEERCRHLRMQLSSMSSRMTETEMSLRSQLAEECQQRKALEIKEKERQVRRRTNPYNTNDAAASAAPSSPISPASDSCDSGFESDAESHYSTHSSASSTSSAAATAASAGSRTPLSGSNKRAEAMPDLISSCNSPSPADSMWSQRSSRATSALFDPTAENFMLRNRVAELESAVEACLRLI